MISLTEFINNFHQECMADIRPYILDEQKELVDLLWPDGDCPEDIIESIINFEHRDFVLENLNTHDWKKVKKFLEKEYDVEVEKENNNDDKKDGIKIFCKNHDDAIYIIHDPKFKNCLEFYNYFYSEIVGNYGNIIKVEPLYSEKVKISNDLPNHAQAYHITTKENGERILKTGLRPKGKHKYRYFPSRVYLILPDKYEDGISLIKETIRLKNIDKNDLCILKVDLARVINYNFYKDVAMPDRKYYIYTYGKIPPEDIKDITEKIKNKI